MAYRCWHAAFYGQQNIGRTIILIEDYDHVKKEKVSFSTSPASFKDASVPSFHLNQWSEYYHVLKVRKVSVVPNWSCDAAQIHKEYIKTDAQKVPAAPSPSVWRTHRDSHSHEKDNLCLFDWIRKDMRDARMITVGLISWITIVERKEKKLEEEKKEPNVLKFKQLELISFRIQPKWEMSSRNSC